MLKKIFYNGLADVITTGVGFLSSVILTRVLGPERWGLYSQLIWLIGFAGTFCSFGLTYAAIRYLGAVSEQRGASEALPLVIWITLAQLILASIGGGVLFVYADRITGILNWKTDISFVRIVSLGVFSFTMLHLAMAILRGLQEFRSLSILSIQMSFFLVITTLITLFYTDVKVLMSGSIISQLILLPWIFSKIWRLACRGASNRGTTIWHPPASWRALLVYSGTVFLTVLADQIVWQRSEIFFLVQLSNSSESGYYSLAYTIATLSLGFLSTALTGTFTPLFSSMTNKEDGISKINQSYQELFAVLNLIVLPASVGLFILAPYLIALLYGEAYIAVSSVLRVLIISSALSIYARPSASVLHALKRPQILLAGSLLAIPVDVILAWKLVPLWGAQGAAIANVMAQLVGAGIAIGYTTYFIGLRYDVRSLTKSLLSAAVCGSVAWLISGLTARSLLGMILTVILGVTIYILVLIWLCDRPTQEAVAWIRGQANQYLSFFSR